MSWIQESYKRSKKLKDHYKLYNIDIYIKDQLPDNISPDFVFKYISKFIPQIFLKGVDIIYVGQFDSLEQRDVNALYEHGAIFVTNKQDDDRDMIDDIIHEIAHSVEEIYQNLIYEDGTMRKEFLGKRKRLYHDLKSHDLNPDPLMQIEVAYRQELDSYFYKEVGYNKMWFFINGLFISPYAATSLREYFAIGFEEYFMGNKEEVKSNCPILYSKLKELEELEEK